MASSQTFLFRRIQGRIAEIPLVRRTNPASARLEPVVEGPFQVTRIILAVIDEAGSVSRIGPEKLFPALG